MNWLASAALVTILMAQPARAAGPEFDPEQPFNNLGEKWLESLLGQALEALDEHFELSGSFNSDAKSIDRKNALRFKFYPNGKSKSQEHIAAEGWFGPSTDSKQEEFHFRFTVPKSLNDSSAALPENVL